MRISGCRRRVVQIRVRMWLVAVCAGGVGLFSGAALAAEWSRAASIRVGEIYTDNVELTSEDEESDLITVVTPRVSVQGSGARARLDLNAAVEYNDLNGDDADNFNPLVNANGNVEVLEDFFFTDVYARTFKTTTDPFRRYGSNSINRAANADTTIHYGLSPYVRKRLGSVANFSARYRNDQQLSADDEFDDSTQQFWDASFTSGPDFSRVNWGLHGSHRATTYDDNVGEGARGQDDEYTSGDARLGYRIDRKWKLTGSVGREMRDYEAEASSRDRATWNVGTVWTPNQRTSLTLGYGDRNFENTPNVDFSWSNRRTTLGARYDRRLANARSLRGLQDDVPGTNPFGEPFDPLTGEPVPVSENLTFLEPGLFSEERFNVSFGLKGNRTTFTLRGRRSVQTREDDGQEATFDDVFLRVSRSLSGKLQVNAGASWHGDEDPDSLTSETIRYYLGLSRQIGPRTSLALNYGYSERDSERPNDDYEENRVYLHLTFNL